MFEKNFENFLIFCANFLKNFKNFQNSLMSTFL